MRRGRRLAIAAALIAAPAMAHVPPPPPDDAPVVAASCGATRAVEPFGQVPASVAPLDPSTLATKGRLRWRWGLRVATGDPRVADVAGMEFSGRYGLLAVTRGGRWLSFDLRGGTLAGIGSVGIAAMKGAAGVPTSVVTLYDERTYVAFAGAHPTVMRYALGACGATSVAVPWIDVTGSADPLIVQAAYTYLGVVGRRAEDGSALVLPNARATATLARRNLLAASGRTLVAASNPDGIVPEIVTAWRARDGRTELELTTVGAWGDVQGGRPTPAVALAVLPRTPAALASAYARQSKTTLLILAFPGPRAGTLDFYAFDSDTPL